MYSYFYIYFSDDSISESINGEKSIDSSHSNNDMEEFLEMDSDEESDQSSEGAAIVGPDYNYDSVSLAQPLIVVAAALVTLVIEKNISATALDSIMTLLMVSPACQVTNFFNVLFINLSFFCKTYMYRTGMC